MVIKEKIKYKDILIALMQFKEKRIIAKRNSPFFFVLQDKIQDL